MGWVSGAPGESTSAATLFQSRPLVPWIVAGLASVGSLLGMVLSPDGISQTMALYNRGLGAFAHTVLAAVIWRVLLAREELKLLLWLQEGEAAVGRAMLGEQSIDSVARNGLQALRESPEVFASRLKADLAHWGPIVKATGFTPED